MNKKTVVFSNFILYVLMFWTFCWQIFVAAALMEYYCSKDKNIAFRIFELGLKKFSHTPEYLLCYIDYLSHLNEDNNTRVLFERVLSSGSLESEKSV